MQLRTKLVLAATAATFAIVLILSVLFLGELLRQRVAQTAAANEVMARQVLMMTRAAIETELVKHPPTDASPQAFDIAVADALRSNQALLDTINGFVRYSPAVQDVSVTDARGWTLLSTDPQMQNQPAPTRVRFSSLRDAGVLSQGRQVFGPPHALDVGAPLNRNGQPFLVVHAGVRSTFMKESYVPYLKDALWLVLLCGVLTMIAAGLLTNLALRPMEEISRRLEQLSAGSGERGALRPPFDAERTDAVVRASQSLDRLGEKMRSTEAGYIDLRANLDQMLDTLRDGVVLFTAERRAAMVSDAAAQFVHTPGESAARRPLVGMGLTEMFSADTALGLAVLAAFDRPGQAPAETVLMEDGREVEFSLDRIPDRIPDRPTDRTPDRGEFERASTLLTLRDKGSALRLEQELEVSRRLAAVGRLTAGVGHEVKNPINAMVVHLELLRAKLDIAGQGREFLGAAMRHVDILAGEMSRLDRVVQTLADFTRPMELHPAEFDLRAVAEAVLELTGAELAEHGIHVEARLESVSIRGDSELLRQALLNLVLNGMQALVEAAENPGHTPGRRLLLEVCHEPGAALIRVSDQGAGISAEVLPRIFDLYFTTKPAGSGIGLAMTYRIVQMHGGSLDVVSEPGAGATFTVRLPAPREVRPQGRTGFNLLHGSTSTAENPLHSTADLALDSAITLPIDSSLTSRASAATSSRRTA